MLSLRMLAIASFIEKQDKVADIGCDHAYLAIHLVKNAICEKVIASDVHLKALEQAKKNVEQAHLTSEIPLYLSDGFLNLPQESINTAILAGMGTVTMLQILEKVSKKHIRKLVLQSNNDLFLLRNSLEKRGYYLQEEKVVFEKGHYYVIGFYNQNYKRLSVREKYFGIYSSENKEYYLFLRNKYFTILKKIKWNHFKEKVTILFQLRLLKKYL